MKKPLLLALLLSVPAFIMAQQKPYVILISFDGFRYDYVKNVNPPAFQSFIKKGTQAEALIPSFPSKTFPNHYTLVTGLYPGHHGLVDNQFYDKDRKETYGMRDKSKVVDSYYYGGVPLWQLARQNGMKAAAYFWVGSEVTASDRHPDYYFPFDDASAPELRITQTLDWLKLPETERPHLITLYFSSPDHEGHDFGPQAEETKKAVLKADTLLSKLMKGLESINLPVNVILVSDHGMAELTNQPETFVFTDDVFQKKVSTIKVVNGGTQTHVYVRDQQQKDSLYQILKTRENNFKVYRQEDFPKKWSYENSRSGDLLLTIAPGHYFRDGDKEKFLSTMKVGKKWGAHGFDPDEVKEMQGIFYASGPNIKSGLTVPAFKNVNVYPLVAKILGLPLPPIDGKTETIEKIYKK